MWGSTYMPQQVYVYARRAAAALLRTAKATSDPELAARLVEAAADVKDHAGELPGSFGTTKPPDVLTEQQGRRSSRRPC
jgi:hypothetical protein